jgi:hypothetical protein
MSYALAMRFDRAASQNERKRRPVADDTMMTSDTTARRVPFMVLLLLKNWFVLRNRTGEPVTPSSNPSQTLNPLTDQVRYRSPCF